MTYNVLPGKIQLNSINLKKIDFSDKLIQLEKNKDEKIHEKHKKKAGIWFEHVPGTKDKFLVNLSDDVLEPLDSEILSSPTQVRLLFMLDRSRSMGKTFSRIVMPACSMLYRRLSPDSCHVILFGETVTSASVQNANYFEENANIELEGKKIM